MDIFRAHGIDAVHHYAPLHYLPFIGRNGALLSKRELRAQGFEEDHFRTKSWRQDVARGFEDCAFLTITKEPPILRAKLAAGFPHVSIEVPVHIVEEQGFSLCRYNIAMTRVLRRGNLPGRPESSTNGRYYDDRVIPIARTLEDQHAMLREHLPLGTMIEVLVQHALALPDSTVVTCFAEADARLAEHIVKSLGVPWQVQSQRSPVAYDRNPEFVDAVEQFVDRALTEPDWRGNGLEYDRL